MHGCLSSERGTIGRMTRAHTPPSRRAMIGLAAAAVLPWALSLACVIYRPIVTRPATLGEELLSIDHARKAGLLTDAEFEARRAQTIAEWKKIADTPIETRP